MCIVGKKCLKVTTKKTKVALPEAPAYEADGMYKTIH